MYYIFEYFINFLENRVFAYCVLWNRAVSFHLIWRSVTCKTSKMLCSAHDVCVGSKTSSSQKESERERKRGWEREGERRAIKTNAHRLSGLQSAWMTCIWFWPDTEVMKVFHNQRRHFWRQHHKLRDTNETTRHTNGQRDGRTDRHLHTTGRRHVWGQQKVQSRVRRPRPHPHPHPCSRPLHRQRLKGRY